MRILFTFVGGRGHFDPLSNIARVAADAGHSVAFAPPRSLLPMVEAAGFRGFALGRRQNPDRSRRRLRPVDRAREQREFEQRFARRAARYRLPLALALLRKWSPDVVVCDETDFGAIAAAECAGLPCATVLLMAAGSFGRSEGVASALGELRAEHAMRPDSAGGMGTGQLVLSPFPPSFRDPAVPLPDTAFSFRATPPAPAGGWRTRPRRKPQLYCTLGTVFNLESGDLFDRVLAALHSLPVDAIVTVGDDVDPAGFGPQPAHVRIESYVAQSSLLPRSDLVVCHAGSGSLIGALAYGLPSVLMPLGADQPSNADRCEDLRVARVLDPWRATPADIRDAVSAVLADRSYRRNAERIRDEIASLPGTSSVVALLERLALRSPGREPGSAP